MTVNAISDIHATLDLKTHKVVYNIGLEYPSEEYVKSVCALSKYVSENEERLSKYDFVTDSDGAAWFGLRPCCKSAKDAVSVMKAAEKAAIRGKMCGKRQLSNQYLSKIYFKMLGIGRVLDRNRLKWHSAYDDLKVIDIRKLADFVRKLGTDFDPSRLKKADVLVIAGDLGLDNFYDDVVRDIEEKTKGKFKKILHIAGNHDLWWMGDERMNFRSKKRPETFNLEHAYCEWRCGDVLFLGCTLWTPVTPHEAFSVGRTMNDYSYSPNFTVADSNTQYALQSAWLRKKIEENRDCKIVVFTHHQPFKELIDDDYKHSDVNSAYVVTDGSLDDIGKYGNIALWVCGHSHGHTELVKNGVRVVRNPIGYRDHYGYGFPEVSPEHWYGNVYEI